MRPFAALEDQTIGALATGLPGAAALFRELGVAPCDAPPTRTLADAAAGLGLPLDGLIDALTARAEAALYAAPTATAPLIDFVVTRYHERHRAELPGLIALAAEVEHAGAGRAEVPAGLAELLDALRSGLEEHMLKEELRVFPLMRADRGDLLARPLALMRGEHEDTVQYLPAVERATRGYRAPPGADPTWRRLYAEVERFADEVIAHVYLEERVLFPRFEAAGG